VHKKGAIVYRTTGTTGKAREFINTHEGFGHFGEQGVRNLWMAGVRPGDFAMGTFPMSLWGAGWGYYYGCRNAGITFLAGGPPYDTRARLEIIFDYHPAAILLTPSYALTLARAAEEAGLDLRKSGVRALIMGGEPFPESRRRKIEEQWGIPGGARDFSGITEGGPIYMGAECEAQDGMHFHEDFAVLEVVKIGGTDPVPPGELGEMVFTALDQRVMGISFHYRTGDVVQYTDAPCKCGRTSRRFKIEGRVDDMVKVRGINIFPSSVEELIRKIPELSGDFMLVLERPEDSDQVTVHVEPVQDLPNGRREEARADLEDRLRRTLTIRVPVALVEPGSLPRFELKAKRWVDRRPKS
jgi:phenylacetate-CoA ligase